ncbi:hypothetical protein IJT17_01330, partial [bacterium]|nr:hypothetical protein [bacterium]
CLGVFLAFLFLRSLWKRSFTKRDAKMLLCHASAVGILAYILYYRTGLLPAIFNYRSCICFKPNWNHLLHLDYYWHCFGKYILLMMSNDLLSIAGQLFLLAACASIICPKRFKPNLEPLLLFILPTALWIFLHFEFAVPRYLVPCLGMQCVIIGSLLSSVRPALANAIIAVMLWGKIVFLAGWMIPGVQLPQSSYDYLDSDSFGVCDSVNAFNENDPFTISRLLKITLSGRNSWCGLVHYNWPQDIKQHGIFAGTFTSKPYTPGKQIWLKHLEESLDIIIDDQPSSNKTIITFTNEYRNGFCLYYSVNRYLAQKRAWNVSVILCHDWEQVIRQFNHSPRENSKYAVFALTLDQQPDNGLPLPGLNVCQRRERVFRQIDRSFGSNRLCAYFPEQCSKVAARTTMSNPFDLAAFALP